MPVHLLYTAPSDEERVYSRLAHNISAYLSVRGKQVCYLCPGAAGRWWAEFRIIHVENFTFVGLYDRIEYDVIRVPWICYVIVWGPLFAHIVNCTTSFNFFLLSVVIILQIPCNLVQLFAVTSICYIVFPHMIIIGHNDLHVCCQWKLWVAKYVKLS